MSIGQRKMIKMIDATPEIVNGEPEASNVTIYRGWAEVRQQSSFRTQVPNQTQLGQLFEFRIRYKDDVQMNVNLRVIYDGKYLAVQSVQKDNEKKFYWTITASVKSFSHGSN